MREFGYTNASNGHGTFDELLSKYFERLALSSKGLQLDQLTMDILFGVE